MKQKYVMGLISLLVVVTVFSVVQYARMMQEKIYLYRALKDKNTQLSVLGGEKTELSEALSKEREVAQVATEKKAILTQMMRAGARKITRLHRETAGARERIAGLSETLALLKQETAELREKGLAMQERLASAVQENELMKAKLGSVKDLKKAIRDLRVEARRIALELRKKARGVRTIIGGNRGYFVKDGRVTTPARVTIDVRPASTP